MSLVEIGRLSVAALLTGVLIWASITDIKDRKIRNVTVLTALILFLPWAVLSTGHAVVADLEAGAVALLAGVAIYSAGWLGAGDAKLFAASSLFIGLHGLPGLAVLTALAGGALAMISLFSRPTRAMTMVAMRGKGDFGRGIPYGVAIAIAAALLVWGGLLHLTPPWAGAINS